MYSVADDRAELGCGHRFAGRGDRFFAATECDYCAGYCPADRAASGGIEQRKLRARAGGRRIARQSRERQPWREWPRCVRGRGFRRWRRRNLRWRTVAGFHPELMTEPLAETDAGTISRRAGTDRRAGEREERAGDWSGNFARSADFGIGAGAGGETPSRHGGGRGRAECIRRPNGGIEWQGPDAGDHSASRARWRGWRDEPFADVQKDRLGVARKFAREHELIVVLKGHRTLVVRPDGEAWVNTTGNPGMSTGGTGDILTGMVAGMIAQNPKDALRRCMAAVHLHGLAGDVMRESVGEHSLVATDLAARIARGFPAHADVRQSKSWCAGAE